MLRCRGVVVNLVEKNLTGPETKLASSALRIDLRDPFLTSLVQLLTSVASAC